MGNVVSYGTLRFQFPHIASRSKRRPLLINEQRHNDVRVERCGAGVVMQPLVSRYYITVPIRL
jgi:hypothetical protein